jgi:hypothetical protein
VYDPALMVKPGLTSLQKKYVCVGLGDCRPNSLSNDAETLTSVMFTDSFVRVSVWPALWSLAAPSV